MWVTFKCGEALNVKDMIVTPTLAQSFQNNKSLAKNFSPN